MPAIGLRSLTILLCVAMMLACDIAAHADPKPLSKEEQAKVDQAIDRGVAFLKHHQTKDGDWPRFWKNSWPVGQCALPAYALLESGVSAEDPMIQKAAAFLRPKALKTAMTYEISLALLFFDRLGDPKDEKLIQRMALRLIAGQFRTGGWSYHNHLTLKEENAANLLKLLEELSKRLDAGEDKAKVVKELEVPRPFRNLTVFQDLRKFGWQEVQKKAGQKESDYLVGNTDNSNTQFAMLGLWAGQRHGVPMGPTFRLMVERFERSQSASGQWSYVFSTTTRPGFRQPASMTCVGLMGLAVGRGAKLSTPGSPPLGKEDLRVLGGLAALYQNIGNPSGSMDNQTPLVDLYFLWSVERVAMLYNLPTIGDKEWYRWGAEILVTNQMKNGSWPGVPVRQPALTRVTRPEYGPALNTAFALLFLKHSHPMKELTTKLPFTAKELNEGIARL